MSGDIEGQVTEARRGPKGPSKPLTDQDFNRMLTMMRIHCTQTEICQVLEMSDTTLNRRLQERGYDNFEDCFKKHNGEGKASLRRMQWEAAENGNSTMLVWLGKQYLGQRDKINAEITGEDGGPIIQRIERVIVDPSSPDT